MRVNRRKLLHLAAGAAADKLNLDAFMANYLTTSAWRIFGGGPARVRRKNVHRPSRAARGTRSNAAPETTELPTRPPSNP